MNSIPQKTIDLFWGKVDKESSKIFYNGTRCWMFPSRQRYGLVWFVDGYLRANRAAWIISHGEIPRGLFVLHHCDNSRCVNPDHLFLGTQKDNVSDMIAKGRKWSGLGEKNPNCKLTKEQVEEIRKLYQRGSRKGYGMGGLSKKFGISRTQIGSIVKNESWK
jgi:hypothetical protein